MPKAIELQKQLEQKRGELAEFVKSHTTNDGLDFTVDEIKAFNDRNDELGQLHDEYVKARQVEEIAQRNEEELKSLRDDLNKPNRRVPFGGGGQQQEAPAFKSLGQAFTESREYLSNRNSSTSKFIVDIEGATLKTATDAVKTVFSTATGYVPYPPQQAGAVPFANRRLVVADLLPQTDTEAPAIIYMEQTTQTINADTVAQGAVKPESAFVWTRRTVPLEVIAHTLPITNQTLEDVPGIRDILDQQMVYGLQYAEEEQILNGTGTSPDLQGFLTKTGVQTQALGVDDQFTAAMKAFTKVRFTGFADVTGGVMHPNDVQDIVTLKDTTGRFIYGDPTMAIGQFRLWGVPVVVTPAMTEDTGLFGDFVMYARLWRKGGIRIEVGFVNDDFARNQQTLRVEERAALQISRAAAFVKVTGL
jgi:HK97 family phage major capsid protein